MLGGKAHIQLAELLCSSAVARRRRAECRLFAQLEFLITTQEDGSEPFPKDRLPLNDPPEGNERTSLRLPVPGRGQGEPGDVTVCLATPFVCFFVFNGNSQKFELVHLNILDIPKMPTG